MNPKTNAAKDRVLKAVSDFFIDHSLPSGKYLVAVSGGVDSVVLLKALNTLKATFDIELGVFHLNHLFRADAADADAALVKQMTIGLDLDYHGYRRPVEAIAESEGLGFEAMGRKMRYQLAKTLFLSEGYVGVFTAHHADDQAETVLMHMFRGSSLKGLTGIAPVHQDKLRPLLAVDKATLLQAAKEWELTAHEDHTNADNAFLRNQVRNTLIPLIATQFGHGVSRQLAQMAEVLRADEDYLNQQTQAIISEHLQRENQVFSLTTRALEKLPLSLQRRVLVAYMHQVLGFASDLTKQPIDQLLQWILQSQVGAQHAYRGVRFEKRRHHIRAMTLIHYQDQLNLQPFPLKLGEQRPDHWYMVWHVSQMAHSEIDPADWQRPDVLLVPGEWQPLHYLVRLRQEGDVMSIPGMQGKHKTLKKLFVEWDLASDQKATTPVLVQGSEILWIPGRVKAEAFSNISSRQQTYEQTSRQYVRIQANRLYK